MNEYSFIYSNHLHPEKFWETPGILFSSVNTAERSWAMEEDKRSFYRQFGRISAIGLEMGLSVAIGLAIGYLLDRYFNTKPWLTIIFLILGVIAGFRSLFSLAREIGKSGRKK